MHPSIALVDSIQEAIYMGHPRAIRLKAEQIEHIDYDKILDLYNDRFKDASDFTFFFVGNADLEFVKPLIAQYLGLFPQ